MYRSIVRLGYFIYVRHNIGRNLQKRKRLHIRRRPRNAQHFSELFAT
jgi:hypothetical protein